MTRVVAVVCAYWETRWDNVHQIVSDLRNGTVVPDRILVLNNNKKLHLEIEGADIINSEFNSRSRGKLAVALMDVADYYLFLDDDTSVGTKTLERFLEVAHRESCYASHGVWLDKGNGVRITPDGVKEETECQYFLGTGMFMSFYSLVRMFMAEERVRVRTEWKHEGEDVLIGLMNKASVIPMGEDANFVALPWGDLAMAFGSDGTSEGGLDYLRMRDRFTKEAIEILEEHPVPKY